MEITLTNAQKALAIIAILVTLIGSAYGGVCYFATAESVESVYEYTAYVEQRLDIKIVMDERNFIQRRIWEIEDRYKYGGMPTDISQQLRDLKIQLQNIDRKLEQIRTGG